MLCCGWRYGHLIYDLATKHATVVMSKESAGQAAATEVCVGGSQTIRGERGQKAIGG